MSTQHFLNPLRKGDKFTTRRDKSITVSFHSLRIKVALSFGDDKAKKANSNHLSKFIRSEFVSDARHSCTLP